MPAYTYLARRQVRIGTDLRQPGELVPEASGWPNLQVYVDNGFIEPIADMSDSERDRAVYRASPSPRTYAPSGPERPPTPIREADRFPAGEGGPHQQYVRCRNCREVNWLAADLIESITWQCWRCNQPQTIREANEHPSPTGIEEWSYSLDVRRPVEPERRIR